VSDARLRTAQKHLAKARDLLLDVVDDMLAGETDSSTRRFVNYVDAARLFLNAADDYLDRAQRRRLRVVNGGNCVGSA